MKPGLQVGLEHTTSYRVPENRTVPALYPEAEEFRAMPPVFATGYLVGLLEWACMQALKPYLEGPEEQTVGTHIAVSHCAATPAGMTVQVWVRLTRVQGRMLEFEVRAHDGVEVISEGTHQRHVISRARFCERVMGKREAAMVRKQSLHTLRGNDSP